MTKPDEHFRAILKSMSEEEEAIEYVSERVKETIEDTRRLIQRHRKEPRPCAGAVAF